MKLEINQLKTLNAFAVGPTERDASLGSGNSAVFDEPLMILWLVRMEDDSGAKLTVAIGGTDSFLGGSESRIVCWCFCPKG